MAIYCFGSINLDHFYNLTHLPAPGETIGSANYGLGLGGKGANQSIAAARAGAQVVHLGAVGADGHGALAQMQGAGVDVSGVQVLDGATGHAIILRAADGENSIILHGGANHAMALDPVLAALGQAQLGDILLMQNETAHQVEVARAAIGLGMEVFYSAAPFDADAVRAVLPYVTTLLLNAVEAAQLQAAYGCGLLDLPAETIIVTEGAAGASWHTRGAPLLHVPALPVQVVDTTGAGDCFAGALAAALDAGDSPEAAMRFASAAAALQVGRAGTADAMPARDEVAQILGGSVNH